MKRFKGYGIVWDAEKDCPLIEFYEGSALTGDERIIEKLTALGYESEDAGDVPETAEDAVQGEIDLEGMSYADLKELAAEKGIEFANNIKKVDLIALIESHE